MKTRLIQQSRAPEASKSGDSGETDLLGCSLYTCNNAAVDYPPRCSQSLVRIRFDLWCSGV
jgi:hypothetical protein